MYEETEEKPAKLSKTSKIVFSVLGAAIVVTLAIPVIYYVAAAFYELISPMIAYLISTFSYVFIRPWEVNQEQLGIWGHLYTYLPVFFITWILWAGAWKLGWFVRIPGIFIFGFLFLLGAVCNPGGFGVFALICIVYFSWWVWPPLIWFTVPPAIILLYALS